jgi:enoyl-CoA hydratase/carnithine racemase
MFGQPEVKLGIIPGYGGTQRLARLVGKGRALEIMITAEMISAAEALRIGLVNRVVPRSGTALHCRRLAKKIMEHAPQAVRFCLEAVHQGLETTQEEGSGSKPGSSDCAVKQKIWPKERVPFSRNARLDSKESSSGIQS